MRLAGSPLQPHHRAALRSRWIDDELADRAFVRTLTSAEGADLIGGKTTGDYSGIGIPIIDPGTDFVREWRVRRDHPDIENGRPKAKYMAPPGRGNMLYFVPGTQPQWLSQPNLPVWLVEGEFKAISLFRAAGHNIGDAAEQPRALVIALTGVWNWRGTIGKANDASGFRVDEKGVIPDMERVTWQGREVTIIFDVNVIANESVRAARKELTRELQQRGARVRWFEWE